MIRPVKISLLACLLMLAATSCGVLDPRLPAVPPPPSLLPGLVLLEVPMDDVNELAQHSVRERRDEHLPYLDQTKPDQVRRILAGQITVGMNELEVVLTMLSHPTRVRNTAPPGGFSYLWEPHRYFVRFDAAGGAVQAGRY